MSKRKYNALNFFNFNEDEDTDTVVRPTKKPKTTVSDDGSFVSISIDPNRKCRGSFLNRELNTKFLNKLTTRFWILKKM